MLFSKLGKAHVPHNKNTANVSAVRIAPGATVTLPLSQHIGAPATATVKVGDKVFVGTLIAEATGFVSAHVHSSVSGTVKKIDAVMQASGRTVPAIVIESDGLMTPDPAIAPKNVTTYKELSDAVREAGLVGLGGAGFPTSVKLDPTKIDKIDPLLINGAECEPYITSDTRTMIDDTDYVKAGVKTVLDLSGIKSCVVGIESNKKECIKALTEVFADDERVKVLSLPATYPQGGEKVLIYNALERVVPEGALPSDVGVLVLNVTTVAYLAKYIATGMPLVEKCITVDGSAIKSPKNVIVPVGMSVGEVVEAAGGFSEEPGKILFGGPMMGIAICSLDEPVVKNVNGITAFNKKDAKTAPTTPCIHCGRCIAACPMGLNPTEFAKAMNLAAMSDRVERLEAAKINLCIECGSCAYVCPAKRPLVVNNKLGKAELREFAAKKANK